MLYAFDTALRHDRIARPYRGAEFHIVEPGVDRQLSLAQSILQQYTGGLRQDLTEDHARNDGIVGKMSLQEEFVTANSILSDGSAFPVFHFVKEQHVVSVRQYRHDFFSVQLFAS